MKKLLALLLAVGMSLSIGAMTASARDDDDDKYENLDFFTIKDTIRSLYPGQDYYFETDWKGTPIDDDFFEYYRVSVSVKSDDDDVSSLTARNRIDRAELIKNEATGEYYFHIRADMSFSHEDDLAILVRVIAKDRDDADTRSWYEMNLDVEYSSTYLPKSKDDDLTTVSSSQYDVNNHSSSVEFDEDLARCRLDFDDGSYYTVRLGSARRFNFGYANVENPMIAKANPGASLYFHSFYGRPEFDNEDVLRLKAPVDKKYLYEIDEDNGLTLVSEENNNGYFGFVTKRLGSYVASNIPLNSPTTAVGASVGKASSTAAAATPAAPAGSLGALQSLLTRNFPNKFVLLSNGTEYGVLDQAVSLSSTVSLEGLDTANLYLYTYDGANNRLVQSPNRPTVRADGTLLLTTNTQGYYVVSSGMLTK